MNTWKWSTGEAYYKSARPVKEPEQVKEHVKEQINSQVINKSLNDDPFNTNDSELISITNSMFSRNQNPTGTRREDLDTKIADRELISQRGVNPFLQNTTYVNDIVARDMFLKPLNTSQDKIKEEYS